MTYEKYTEQFLTALSDDQLTELIASLKAEGKEPQASEYELLTRIDAELNRRKAPPPS